MKDSGSDGLGVIHSVGLSSGRSGLPRRPTRVLGRYALVYVVDGHGRYLDRRGNDVPLGAGDLIVIFPERAHTYRASDGQGWTQFWMTFTGAVFDLWRDHGLLEPGRPVHHAEPVTYWLSRFRAVLDVPGGSGRSSPAEVCRLQLLLAEMLDRRAEASGEPVWLTRARHQLGMDDSPRVDLHGLAERLGLPYDRFRREFTRAVGMPPARYRDHRRMNRACELIEREGRTNAQIAEQLGFCDEFHFSRRFRRILGLSPRQYRERSRS